MGLDFDIEVPTTVEEFDSLAKKPGAALNEAILNVIYRGTLKEVRDRFITALEKAVGMNFPTVQRKNKDGSTTEIYDPEVSDGDFIETIRAKKSWMTPEAWKAGGIPILLEALKGDPKAVLDDGKPDEAARKPVVFDPTASERGVTQPKKLPAAYLDAATRVFTNNNQHKMVDRLKAESDGTVLVAYVPEPKHVKGNKESEEAHAAARQTNIMILGWAIRASQLYIAAKNQASYA
jgi:hypothetical protein